MDNITNNLVRRVIRYRRSLSVSYNNMQYQKVRSMAITCQMDDTINGVDQRKWKKRYNDVSILAQINPFTNQNIRQLQTGGSNNENCIFCKHRVHISDCIWVWSYLYYCAFKFNYTDMRYCVKCGVRIWLHEKDERGNWIKHNYSNGQPHMMCVNSKQYNGGREDIYSDCDDYTEEHF